VRAYHAADSEPVGAESVTLAMAAGDRIGELILELHPSVSLVESAHAVVSLWAAHQGDGDFDRIDISHAETGLVVRSGLDVLVLGIPPGAGVFVSELRREKSLGEAAARASALASDFDLSATLAILLGQGALISIHLPKRNQS
jgi:hypothetical protein